MGPPSLQTVYDILVKTVTLALMPDLGPPKGLYTKNDWLADSVNVTVRLNNRLSENPASINTQRVITLASWRS
jgi:hypothetical protein